MNPDDIRMLADASPYQRELLRALADVMEACTTERHTCYGRNRRGSNCAICKALARVEALTP